MTIRIALGDDHRLFRQALGAVFRAEPEFEIVGEAGTGAEILALVARLEPDLLLLDIALPDLNGIEVARQIRQRQPGVRIVALTGYADPAFVEEMIKAGAQGYVAKSAATEELFNAVRTVAAGRDFLSAEAAHALLHRFQRDDPASPPPSVLSPREQEVLRLLAEGKRSAQIAGILGISPATVDVHRRHIKEKLHEHTTAGLTRYAVREGLARA